MAKRASGLNNNPESEEARQNLRATGHDIGRRSAYLASARRLGDQGLSLGIWMRRCRRMAEHCDREQVARRAINRFANHRADGAESLFCVASKYSRSNPSSAVRVAGARKGGVKSAARQSHLTHCASLKMSRHLAATTMNYKVLRRDRA